MAHEELTLLSVSQAASFLGVHPNTIRRWAQCNQLKGQRLGTRGDWRFTREELSKMLKSDKAVHRDSIEQKGAEERSQKARERFQIAEEAANGFIYDWEVTTDSVFRSNGFTRILGYGIHELASKRRVLRELVHPEDLPLLEGKGDKADGNNPNRYAVEYRVRHKDGHYVHVLDTALAVRDEKGIITRIVGSITDITERRRAEQALRESEERLRLATQSASMYEWEVDLTSQTFKWSENAEHVVDFPMPKTTTEMWTAVHAENRAEVEKALEQAIETCGEFQVEYRMSNTVSPGEEGWLFSAGVAIAGAQGTPPRVVGITQNITERKRAQEALRESEEQFRAMADNIPNLAWMAKPDGWIYWYNKRWYDYTGTSLQEMEGWGWQKVHHPAHVERVVEKISQCFSTGEVWEDTFPLRGKDGSYRWFLSRAIPIRDEQGKVSRWFGTNTDITEQKQLEQQKDEFLGIASHELKTPVTSIKAYAQLLERRFRKVGDARASEQLQKMDTQLNKLTTLIGDLLDVTKIESGKLQLRTTSFDFNELIREIVEETQHMTSRHTIVQELAPVVTLTTDRERIGQVLTNLLTNAIKYSPQAETVVVKTVSQDGTVMTSVQDFGIGIPSEKQARIFERFYRVEGERHITYPGLGLGLYISAEFVKRHHGSIWVESEEGKGTTFSFCLPLSSPSMRHEPD